MGLQITDYRLQVNKYNAFLRTMLVIASVFFVASGGIHTAKAQIGVQVQPAIIEGNVNPGDTFNSVIRVTNQESITKSFYIAKRDIRGLDAAGQPIFAVEGETDAYTLISWIQPIAEPIIIESGKTSEIPFSVNIPKDASPGSHFGSIFVVSRAVRPGESGSGVGYEVGTIVNLKIAGAVVEEAQIREFRADREIYWKPETAFTVRVENLGNVLVRPTGFIELADFFGKNTATLRINESRAVVFPKDVRSFDAAWKGGITSFGRYQATLSLVYGDEGRKTVSGTFSFWVLPIKIILPVLGGIAGFILAVWLFVKFQIKRKLRQLQATMPDQVKMEQRRLERQAPVSRLALVVIALLAFTVIFLIALFVFLA